MSTGLLVFWLRDHPQLLDTDELRRNEMMKQNQSVFDSDRLTDVWMLDFSCFFWYTFFLILCYLCICEA